MLTFKMDSRFNPAGMTMIPVSANDRHLRRFHRPGLAVWGPVFVGPRMRDLHGSILCFQCSGLAVCRAVTTPSRSWRFGAICGRKCPGRMPAMLRSLSPRSTVYSLLSNVSDFGLCPEIRRTRTDPTPPASRPGCPSSSRSRRDRHQSRRFWNRRLPPTAP